MGAGSWGVFGYLLGRELQGAPPRDTGKKQFDINSGYHVHKKFYSDGVSDFRCNITVEGGAPINFALVDEMNLRYFKDGADWRPYYLDNQTPVQATISTEESVDFTIEVPDGEWYLLMWIPNKVIEKSSSDQNVRSIATIEWSIGTVLSDKWKYVRLENVLTLGDVASSGGTSGVE